MKFARCAGTPDYSPISIVNDLMSGKQCISFAEGLPDASLYPLQEMIESTKEAYEKYGSSLLDYGDSYGFLPLRRLVAKRMKERFGISAYADQIQITTGSQQAITLLAKLLVDQGDIVLVENPSYADAINVFHSFGAIVKSVPTDADGMIPSELERMLHDNQWIKMIYIIPDFQNPTGRTWSKERRRAVAELARQYDVAVVEDGAYCELYYGDNKPRTVASFDKGSQVFFLGSFSKIMAPGLRLGWICNPYSASTPLNALKEGEDLSTPTLMQAAMAEYMTHYDLEAHISHLRQVYREKRDVMYECLKQYFPADTKIIHAEGGFFLWVEMEGPLDMTELLSGAIEQGVAYIPGYGFDCCGGSHNAMRLNFSQPSLEEIRTGIQRLGNYFTELHDAYRRE